MCICVILAWTQRVLLRTQVASDSLTPTEQDQLKATQPHEWAMSFARRPPLALPLCLHICMLASPLSFHPPQISMHRLQEKKKWLQNMNRDECFWFMGFLSRRPQFLYRPVGGVSYTKPHLYRQWASALTTGPWSQLVSSSVPPPWAVIHPH